MSLGEALRDTGQPIDGLPVELAGPGLAERLAGRG